MPTYSWLTISEAVAALQGRLSNDTFWSVAELKLYLFEALRHWNGLTNQWNSNLIIPNANGAWLNTGTITNSPRLRTQTDTNLYTQIEYMLLEPPTGGVWSGTNQFSISALQFALQKRTQETIQAVACNLGQLSPLNSSVGTRRNLLADTVLEPRRIRVLMPVANVLATVPQMGSQWWMSISSPAGIAPGQLVTGTGIPPNTFVLLVSPYVIVLSQPVATMTNQPVQFSQVMTLTREDTQAFQFFNPSYLQETGIPQSWSIASEPPLAFDVDLAPNSPAAYDLITLNAAPTFAPPASTLLGIPDDWSLVPLYGALADLLGRESEATDRARAAYCLERYTSMLKMFKGSNWLVQAAINGVPIDTPSLAEMDDYGIEWQQSNSNLPALIQAGIDFCAPTPAAVQGASIGGLGYGQGGFGGGGYGGSISVGSYTSQSLDITLLANAPLLDSTGVYVQVSRDDFEAVLNYAQHVATFKSGGAEFTATAPLLKDFYRAAAALNKRWINYGIFVDILREQGERQEVMEPR